MQANDNNNGNCSTDALSLKGGFALARPYETGV